MSPRNPEHDEYDGPIFEAFLSAYPTLESNIQCWYHPDNDFPDIETVHTDGKKVQWELGRWLQCDQMRAAKKREQLEANVMQAIGNQAVNRPQHILFCMLFFREYDRRFDQRDAESFRDTLMHLIQDVDAHWQHNREWQSRGYSCIMFDEYPVLKKYLSRINFEPRMKREERQYWPSGEDWICPESWADAYNPQIALEALTKAIRDKVERYGLSGKEDVRLIVHYNEAVLYNTPYRGFAGRSHYRNFQDVAELAANEVRKMRVPFKKVYLLNVPEREAFEIYPVLLRCN